jgi:large subunit ribosomal protein LP0
MRVEGITEDEFRPLEQQFGGQIPELAALAPLIKDKVALIFSDASVHELRIKIEANKVPTEARVGVVSPIDFTCPSGPTGLDPSQINFFHALNISTKIVKGQIEITKDFKVCTKGKKIKNSEAALLKKLNIKPFEYGMKIADVYDEGAILPEAILNLDPSSLIARFEQGVKNITALSLGAGYPIEATIPLIIGNAFKNIAAFSLESGYALLHLDSRSRKLSLLPALPPPRWRPRRRSPRRKRPSRRRKRRLLPPLPPRRKNRTWTWADSSTDRYLNIPQYFKSHVMGEEAEEVRYHYLLYPFSWFFHANLLFLLLLFPEI